MKTQSINPNYLARAVAGVSTNYPVDILGGKNDMMSPTLTGESYGWEKLRGPNAGQRVPASYARKWWGNVGYVASTLSVEVGEKMLEKLMREIGKPPAGMTVAVKNFALEFRRVSDGIDYHCPAKILLEKGWRGKVRSEMAKNYLARREMARAEKSKKKEQEIYARQSANVRVTLADSRRAGNCVEGSLQFAEQKLGVSRAEILAGQHLISFSASLLRRVANGDAARVEGAIRAAWERETTISI